MKVIEIKRYAFEELSPEAQAKAIEGAREREYRNDLASQFLTEEMPFEVERKLGLTLPADFNIFWSLSYGQGDGVSFQGTLTRESAPELNWPANAYRLDIKHMSNHYCHAYTFDVIVTDEEGEEIEDTGLLEQFRELSKHLERFGYKWLEDYYSDQNMRALLEDTGDVFTSAGKYDDPARE